jgi:hypothetical protein
MYTHVYLYMFVCVCVCVHVYIRISAHHCTWRHTDSAKSLQALTLRRRKRLHHHLLLLLLLVVRYIYIYTQQVCPHTTL